MELKIVLVISVILSLIFGFVGGIFAVRYYPEIVAAFPEFFPGVNNLSLDTEPSSTIIRKEVITSEEEAVINVVKEVSSSVVSVILTKDVPVFEEYWESPFELFPELQVPGYRQKGTEEQKVGGGSGFIISADGLIITNRHVVEKEDVDYTVVLNDGKKYPARILARDPIQDLAVIKIERKNLPIVKLGNSDNLRPGQTVIAIGYALGELQNTVSVGVISGLERNITAGGLGTSERIEGIIQTDAAINPGNSGGPLLNLSGEIIGINTAMAYGAENIGFAIPINKAKKTINEVKTKGKVTYPFLGVSYTLINEDLRQEYDLSVNYGALIIKDDSGISVIPGSSADKAGLEENDIILEVDGEKITEENSLAKVILEHKVGDKIKLKILRKGKKIELGTELGER